ncbi:MAG: hypothetical protein R2759_20780 [Bacteroidales bacterium]
MGGISDENARDMVINFDFLPDGITFEASIYKDGAMHIGTKIRWQFPSIRAT